MPYVVKIRGRFLYRSANASGHGGRRRELTDDINRATVFQEPGPARNAARCALANGLKGDIEVVPVAVTITPSREA